MAKPWAEVADSPGFQGLDPEAQESARNKYFEQVVAPRIPEGQDPATIRAQFDAHTRPAAPAPTPTPTPEYAQPVTDPAQLKRMEEFGSIGPPPAPPTRMQQAGRTALEFTGVPAAVRLGRDIAAGQSSAFGEEGAASSPMDAIQLLTMGAGGLGAKALGVPFAKSAGVAAGAAVGAGAGQAVAGPEATALAEKVRGENPGLARKVAAGAIEAAPSVIGSVALNPAAVVGAWRRLTGGGVPPLETAPPIKGIDGGRVIDEITPTYPELPTNADMLGDIKRITGTQLHGGMSPEGNVSQQVVELQKRAARGGTQGQIAGRAAIRAGQPVDLHGEPINLDIPAERYYEPTPKPTEKQPNLMTIEGLEDRGPAEIIKEGQGGTWVRFGDGKEMRVSGASMTPFNKPSLVPRGTLPDAQIPAQAAQGAIETNKVWYHGSPKAGFKEFDPYGQSKHGLFGQGTYFTDNPDVASGYAMKKNAKTPGIYTASLNVKNPIDMDAPVDMVKWRKVSDDILARHMEDLDIKPTDTNEKAYKKLEEYIIGQEVPNYEGAEMAQDALRSMGYDGIKHVGGGRVGKGAGPRHNVLIAFDPEQIMPVTPKAPPGYVPFDPVARVKDAATKTVANIKENRELANLFQRPEEALGFVSTKGAAYGPKWILKQFAPMSQVFPKWAYRSELTEHAQISTFNKFTDAMSDAFKGMERDPQKLEQVAKILDGKPTKMVDANGKVVGLAPISPDVRLAAKKMRLISDKFFDWMGIGGEHYRKDWFPHAVWEDPKKFEAPEAGITLKRSFSPFTKERQGAQGYKYSPIEAYTAYFHRQIKDAYLERFLNTVREDAKKLNLSAPQQEYLKAWMSVQKGEPRAMEQMMDGMIKNMGDMVNIKVGGSPARRLSNMALSAVYHASMGLRIVSGFNQLAQVRHIFSEMGTKTAHGLKLLYSPKAWESFKSSGLAGADQVAETMTRANLISGSRYRRVVDKLMLPVRFADNFTRGMAWHSGLAEGAELAKKNGWSPQQVRDYAIGIVRKTNFPFGRTEVNPWFSGPIGKLLYQFSHFPQQEAWRYYNLMKEGELKKMVRLLVFDGAMIGGAAAAGLSLSNWLGYVPLDQMPVVGNKLGETELPKVLQNMNPNVPLPGAGKTYVGDIKVPLGPMFKNLRYPSPIVDAAMAVREGKIKNQLWNFAGAPGLVMQTLFGENHIGEDPNMVKEYKTLWKELKTGYEWKDLEKDLPDGSKIKVPTQMPRRMTPADAIANYLKILPEDEAQKKVDQLKKNAEIQKKPLIKKATDTARQILTRT